MTKCRNCGAIVKEIRKMLDTGNIESYWQHENLADFYNQDLFTNCRKPQPEEGY